MTEDIYHYNNRRNCKRVGIPTLSVYLLFAASYIRPWEVYPELESLRLPLVLPAFSLIFLLLSHNSRFSLHLGIYVNKLVLALIVIAVLSIPFSFWPGGSADRFYKWLPVLSLFFILVSTVDSERKLLHLLSLFVFTAAYHSYHLVNNFLIGKERYGRVFGISGGEFENPNELGLLFVTALPVAFMLQRIFAEKWRKLVFSAIAALLMGGIFVSESRGAITGLFLVLGGSLMSYRRKPLFWITMLISIIITLNFLPDNILDRWKTTSNYQQDESAMGRIYAWKAGVNMIMDFPLVGVGIGQFQTAFGTKYKPVEFESNFWVQPHNIFIQITTELGLIGGFILITLLSQIFKRTYTTAGLSNFLILFNRHIFLSLLGFVFCAFFVHSGYSVVFYTLLAFCAVGERLRNQNATIVCMDKT